MWILVTLLLSAAAGQGAPRGTPTPGPTVVLDRIAAVVGDDLVLESDIRRLIDIQLEPRLATESDAAYRERVLQRRIVDLLREQELRKTGGLAPDPKEVKTRLDALAERALRERGEPFDAVLEKAHVSREEVAQWVQRGLGLETFTRERLLPTVKLSDSDVKAYYEGPFKAEAAARGLATVSPLSEVQDQIRDLLRERRLNEEIQRWTEELRQKTRVLIYRRESRASGRASSDGPSASR